LSTRSFWAVLFWGHALLPYYAGEEGLQIYSEPRETSTTLARLPLHQKVYRDKIEKGYAHVKVEGTNLTGWVENAKLIWRLPDQSTSETPKTEKQIAEPTPETQPTLSSPQAESLGSPTDKPISPSIFNPF
jgi:hypothetical protein